MDESPNVETVRALGKECSNWGRWGAQDQLGTLNLVEPADIVRAASLVRTGRVVSLSIPLDEAGPQHPGSGRPNPTLFMTVDGRDFMSGPGTAEERDRKRGYLQNADSVVILPLQSSTQWDGLAHVFFEQQMYNGYSAGQVTSRGAQRNGVSVAGDKGVGRGVLLDLPAVLGVDWLEPGHAISGDELDAACEAQQVTVGRGDFVLVRTGSMSRSRQRGAWGDYAGGDAPGLGLGSARWLRQLDVAGVATDTWDIEARPVATPDVAQPVHIVLLVHMGLWLGEIFDMEELASVCAAEGRFDFLLVAPPLKFTGGIGSPVNPLAIF